MQPWKNGKNPNFGPNSGLPKIYSMGFTSTSSKVKHYKLSSYVIFRKTKKPNLKKGQKNPLILGLILTHLAQIWAPKFFFVGFTSISN